jgi:cyanate permease
LIAHLFSLLVPQIGEGGAGLAMAAATSAAIMGRLCLGWLLAPGADRRRWAAANIALQILACLVLLAADGAPTLLLLGVVLFGFALGNVTTLPPLIAQQDFAAADTARIVGLVTASGQALYAFAPALFGLLREVDASGSALFLAAAVAQLAAAAAFLAGRRGR